MFQAWITDGKKLNLYESEFDETSGALHLAQPGLTAGRLAGDIVKAMIIPCKSGGMEKVIWYW